MEKLKTYQRIEEEIAKLLQLTNDYIDLSSNISAIEKGLLKQLLAIGLVLLKHIISEKQKKLAGVVPEIKGITKLYSKGLKFRNYLSIFGSLSYERSCYWSKESKSYYPLDDALSMPVGVYWSYNIQELVGESSAENDYRESVIMINKILGLNLEAEQSARNASCMGDLVTDYYESNPPCAENRPVCFNVSFDGKGVPKITNWSEKKDPRERLKRGEKKGIKQMATVCVISCFAPQERTVEDIIQGLMDSPLTKIEKKKEDKEMKEENKKNTTQKKWHEQVHRRAFLADQEKAIKYGLLHLKQRMQNPESRFVVPIDGGVGLEDRVLANVKEYGLTAQFDGIILDIIHVSEYVWDAATAIYGADSDKRKPWVRKILTYLLESKTTQVINKLESKLENKNLSKSRKKQIQKSINYFTNHQHKMNYKEYLEKGYPVSSALIESTCGHLVKERLEMSGMRWSSEGAQSTMDLRALKLNGDLEDFMSFRMEKDRKGHRAAA